MRKIIYFNDPVGLKTKQIKLDKVKNIEELLLDSVSIISTRILDASNFKLFFAQNLTTHFSSLLNVVKSKNTEIDKVYITDHEVRWVVDLITKQDYNPADMTHSNYCVNEKIFHPPYKIEIIDFESVLEKVCKIKEPAIFFFSHVSRMTGQLIEAEKIFNTIKKNNPDSIIVLDGAQVLGGSFKPVLKNICDVYLGVSSKFLGAEPHIGIAAISIDLFNKYYDNKYIPLEINKHQFDIYSLASNLKNESYVNNSYIDYIQTLNNKLRELLMKKSKDIVVSYPNQISNFFTISFGSYELNKKFINYSKELGIILSDNTGWSVSEPKICCVRIGLSIRNNLEQVEKLASIILDFYDRIKIKPLHNTQR